MITREDLTNYKFIEEAIERCRIRLNKLRHEDKTIVFDKVKGSNTESPYELRSYRIEGVDPQYAADYAKRLSTEQRELLRLTSIKSEIDDLIASIENVRDKMIFEYIIEGRPQDQISWKVGVKQPRISKIIQKYLPKE